MSNNQKYTVGWTSALPTELSAAIASLDARHPRPEETAPNDCSTYILGEIAGHNVVMASLPVGEYGTTSAAIVSRDMLSSFPNVRFGLMVGIGGGAPAPKQEIRLGGGVGGVIQYDYGKALQNRSFITTGHLNQPPQSLSTAVTVVRAIHDGELYHLKNAVGAVLQGKESNRKFGCPPASSDRLFVSKHIHTDETKSCEEICGGDPSVLVIRNTQDDNDEDGEGAVLPVAHYGLIASGNQVMKDSAFRDKLAESRGVLCFEMEAAGLMNHFPCLVV
ncbi:hypothetical protein CTRI78_v001421 [Colletotrichum trifolii]|uniref:Nucleoside phosphorylase domain-containing protein n=1 Tax=Colletotrichum trifolii TaxID=5466 RepID=A0A4R8RQ47_COLTR|nr:hypothetical protein CTRI78_v001421 [Colletotrichum trifolii]